jgi:hypothetical protein
LKISRVEDPLRHELRPLSGSGDDDPSGAAVRVDVEHLGGAGTIIAEIERALAARSGGNARARRDDGSVWDEFCVLLASDDDLAKGDGFQPIGAEGASCGALRECHDHGPFGTGQTTLAGG